MKRKLFTRIGFISILLMLVMALGPVMIGAQPADTGTATATPTPTPPPANSPIITSFNITLSRSDNNTTPPTNADVKIEIRLDNVNLSTSVPEGSDTVTGMLKFCYDVGIIGGERATVTPNAPPVVPTVTDDTAQALPGNCLVTTNRAMTLLNVPPGQHLFSVELVNPDGSSMDPKISVETLMYVSPPQ
jgi:hypothetical protein